ncbi:hypothetical protein FRACYDRAFT_270029 [Fragilariopsis cylindrus CCMP1102]|uniref:Uncharacterized protein n=1 Tax=Fragilariopsis cylindrus CCMP1102 TaxID=635003 RepID=A0A1E7F4Q7_9STRA|nr:hypothetical protein FRACYDRAFT_270029 [Fragilariopsis cylindrus CCMP1102]|eukprot:OEU13119.1 hypothetical protein FRACYDRAFT_270029 [Fragilariopsis cylindrus CCMP1102]
MEFQKNNVPLADREGGNSNIDEDVPPRAVGSSPDQNNPGPIIGTITATTPIDSSDNNNNNNNNNDIPFSYNPSTTTTTTTSASTVGSLLRCSSSRDGIASTGGSGLGYSLCPSPPSVTIQMPTSPTPTKFGFTYKSSLLDDDDDDDEK